LKGKRVFVTGHTGFKGAWLVAMLQHQGASVTGFALDPVPGGIFERAGLTDFLKQDIRGDIRNKTEVLDAIKDSQADLIIHMAAQPLVLSSYEKPSETYETNVVGTLNVLDAVRTSATVQSTLIVTTDKVYRQTAASLRAFTEDDPMGAADPYSTSKAMADLLTQSWIKSFPESRTLIARAGNVIGGGDVSENRLVPDLIRAFSVGDVARVRNPNSVRPWQHVLDCLNGYLVLADKSLADENLSGPFNFGPKSSNPVSVAMLADKLKLSWNERASWETVEDLTPKEAAFLTLDSSKSKTLLGWEEKLSSLQAIDWTVDWYKQISSGASAREVTFAQLDKFLSIGSP
jgi:CDP-glucose 4,6-dehydratase